MHEDEKIREENIQLGIDGLLEILKKVPKSRLLMINGPRHEEAIRSIQQIVEYVRQESPDAEVSVSYDGIIGTCLLLEIVTDMLNIYNIKDFFKMAEAADTMDVVPLLDSKISIGFTYENARMPV